MANKKIQATATLFLDTKDAQSDAKKFVNDLKQKLSEVETAADKMTVFKDMVAYIAQVDRALAALRKNNKEAFNSMFDGLDINLKQQLEGLFGVNGAQLGQVDALREKLNTLTLKSSIKEIRTFAKEINALFTGIGVSAPFDNIDEQFSGRTNTGHIQALATSLANFATVWEDLSANIAKGLGIGGEDAGISGALGNQNKEIQEKIDKLKKQKEEYQEIIDAFSGKDVKIQTSKKTDVAQLQELINKFNEAQAAVQQFEIAGNTSGDGYKKAVAEAFKMATLLKNTMDYVAENGSDAGALFVSSNVGKNDPYSLAEKYIKDLKNTNIFNNIQTYLNQQVQDIDVQINKLQSPIENTLSLYDELNQKMQEYFEIKKQLANVEKDTPEYDKLQDRQRAIQGEVLTLKKLSEEQEDSLYGIFDDIDETDVSLKNALTNICNTLSVEIPQATVQAGEQIDTFGKKIVNVSEYVSALSGQLKEMFAAAGRSANFEYHIAIDGLDIKARHGSEKSVDLATQTETYLDTLFSDSVLYGHSHRGGTSATNIYDIETVLSSYRDGVSIPVHFVVGKDSITTMDFTGLSKDMANQLMQEIAATNSNKNAPVINESINKIVEKFTGNSGALKTWNVDQFDDLAKYIYDISSAASSALTPIEKFQSILDNMFGKGKVDATKYESLLSGLDKDNAKSIFNQIASMEKLQPIKTTDMLTMGQVNAEIDESIAKYKTLREEANLSYVDIRNEVDKVIEHYNAGGSATSGLDFFQKYFPEGEWQNVRNLLTDAYDNLISIEEVTNRIAGEFGVDPDTFAQIPNGVQTSQIVDETNQKLREQEQLWENVSTTIKEVFKNTDAPGFAITLDNLKDEILDVNSELMTAEQCAQRFVALMKEQNYDFGIIGENEEIREWWDRYQGNAFVNEGQTTIDTGEYNKFLHERAELLERISSLQSKVDGMPDTYFTEGEFESSVQEYCVEIDKLQNELAELKVSYEVLKDVNQFATEDLVDYEREVADLNKTIEDLQTKLSSKTGKTGTGVDSTNAIGDSSLIADSEVAQLELLQNKLLEVKTAVDAKTQAFEEEYVTVDSVVDAEITSLQSLITQLHEVITQINLINDGFNNINTNVPKIELKSAPVDQSVATENTHYVTDPQGRPVTMYRGIRNSYSGLVSNRYHGGTFSTDNLELAKEYAGELGKVEKVLLSMKNPLEIDGHGAFWNQIEYIGDNSDEASQKLYELNASIRATKKLLADAENIPVSDQELRNISRGFITEENTKRAREISYWTKELKKHQEEKAAILADTSNPYGKKNTNELVEIAKAKGYDGVIFKNIIDSATGDVKDLSTVMVTFEQDQIHYIETIASTFESSITELKNHFGGLTKHISASGEEVEASIRKMVELRGKLNVGEISEDEYNAFLSGNAIARDYKKLAKKSMAVPDFITGALDGDEFELKHVIQMINDMLDNMRHRVQKVAKAFGKEGISLDQLLVDSTNVAPITESPADKENAVDEVEQLNKLQTVLTEVKNAILAKTKAFVDEGDVVGQVVGKEVSALMKLAETVDSIVPKVNTLSDGLKSLKEHGIDIKDQNMSKIESDNGQSTRDAQEILVDEQKILKSGIDIAREYYKALNMSEKQVDAMSHRMTEKALTKAFKLETNEDNAISLPSDRGAITESGIKLYKTYDAILQTIGYHLGEIRMATDKGGVEIGLKADIITNSEKVVTNFEQARDILFGIGTAAKEASQETKNFAEVPVEDSSTKAIYNQKKAFNEYGKDLQNVDYLTKELRTELNKLGVNLQQVDSSAKLKEFQKAFENVKAKISAAKGAFDKVNFGNINSAENNLVNTFNNLTFDQKLSVEQEYKDAIKVLEQYRVDVQNGKQVELSAIEDTVKALREKIEVYKQANKEANNAGSAQKKNSKFGDTVSRNATAKYNSLMGSANSDQFANSKEVAAIVGEYEKAYKAMITFRNELRNSDGVVSEADEAEFKRLTTECNEYAKALDKLIKSTMKLKGNKANPNDYMLGSDFVDNAQGRKQALTDFVKSVYDIDVAAEDFRKDWNEVVFAVDNGDGTFTQMTARLTDARNEIVALAGDTNKIQGKFESFVDGVKNRLQSLSQYFIATVGIYDVWNVIKQGIQYVRDIDNALTELKKVTDATESSYDNFLQTASKTAATLGSTVSDFVDATADFARLGYDLNQASQLAEAASVYKNVGDGIDDIATASESIISTMKAFGIEANNAMGIVDRFNEVGKFIAQII